VSWSAEPYAADGEPIVRCEVFERAGETVVRLVGELDITSVGVVRGAVRGLIIDRDCAVLVLDLAGLSFIDSSGLNLLVTIKRDVSDAGAGLLLRAPQTTVRRVLELSGLDTFFVVE
jgi:anti-anti-sigma factor